MPGRYFLKAIGAFVRWLFGTIWRTLQGRRRIRFGVYLNGPTTPDDWFDSAAHSASNLIVGIATLLVLAIILLA